MVVCRCSIDVFFDRMVSGIPKHTRKQPSWSDCCPADPRISIGWKQEVSIHVRLHPDEIGASHLK
ncbi:hypothetical protein BOS5A_30103 [Bosea sp. EC-HK365B]|nr:hypothetical protein BOS5A_30103 [Bosea sp. EC-HK365B]